MIGNTHVKSFTVKLESFSISLQKEAIPENDRPLGTTSKYGGTCLSLQCKDSAADPLPLYLYSRIFVSSRVYPYIIKIENFRHILMSSLIFSIVMAVKIFLIKGET